MFNIGIITFAIKNIFDELEMKLNVNPHFNFIFLIISSSLKKNGRIECIGLTFKQKYDETHKWDLIW
jgi:hypothetical protein